MACLNYDYQFVIYENSNIIFQEKKNGRNYSGNSEHTQRNRDNNSLKKNTMRHLFQ